MWISSLGKEPVSVNGIPITEPTELFNGDKIEVRPASLQFGWHPLSIVLLGPLNIGPDFRCVPADTAREQGKNHQF